MLFRKKRPVPHYELEVFIIPFFLKKPLIIIPEVDQIMLSIVIIIMEKV